MEWRFFLYDIYKHDLSDRMRVLFPFFFFGFVLAMFYLLFVLNCLLICVIPFNQNERVILCLAMKPIGFAPLLLPIFICLRHSSLFFFCSFLSFLPLLIWHNLFFLYIFVACRFFKTCNAISLLLCVVTKKLSCFFYLFVFFTRCCANSIYKFKFPPKWKRIKLNRTISVQSPSKCTFPSFYTGKKAKSNATALNPIDIYAFQPILYTYF